MSAAKIRERVLGNRATTGRVVSFDLPGPNGPEKFEVELRQPNRAMLVSFAQRAGLDDKKKRIKDLALYTALILSECAYEPGTSERAFAGIEIEDLRRLGPEYDPLIEAAI